MKISWLTPIAVACAVLTVNAQDQTHTRPPTGAPAAVDRGGNQTVLVTGCVARHDAAQANAADSGRAAAGGNESAFVLTGARMSNDSPTGTAQPSAENSRNTPPAPSATTAPAAADRAATAAAGQRYLLHSASTDLTAHVGHQVEVTGRFDTTVSYPQGIVVGTSGTGTTPPAAGSSPSPTGTTPSASGTANPKAADTAAARDASATPSIRVESIRMIALACAANQ